jgi:hypothetical protein
MVVAGEAGSWLSLYPPMNFGGIVMAVYPSITLNTNLSSICSISPVDRS